MKIEWLGVIFVNFMLLGSMLLIKLLENKLKVNAEGKRKVFHITMGLVVLTFPYIFKSELSAVMVGISSIVVLVIIKNTRLKKSIGTILYSVSRESLGEIFFAISVVTIFCLSKGDKILYSIPVLILTFADSSAALIGKNYGKKNIAQINEDKKSIEGSFIFFIVAFMATLVPLLLFTTVGREETLIIATIIGFNVALVEMISHTGNDNLLIPLTTYAFLVTHISMPIETLRVNLVILVGIFVLTTIVNRVKVWSKLALAESLVVGYLTITLYGIYAIIPPLLLILTTLRFPKLKDNEKSNLYDARIIETNIVIGIAICGIAAILNLRRELFMIYSLVYAMHLAINTCVRFRYYFSKSEIDSILLSFSKAVVFIFIPSLIIQKVVFGEMTNLLLILIMTVNLFLSSVVIMIEKKNVKKEEITVKNGYMHMRIVLVLTILTCASQYFITNVI